MTTDNVSQKSDCLEWLSCICFIILILSDFILGVFHTNILEYFSLGVLLFVAFIRILGYKYAFFRAKIVVIFGLLLAVFFFCSQVTGNHFMSIKTSPINFYIIPMLLAFIYTNNLRAMLRHAVIIILVVQIIFQLYEAAVHHYIFSLVANINGKIVALDAKLYSGSGHIFRAKGLFSGPLSAAGIAIIFCCIYKNDLTIASLSFFVGILANARFALLVIGLLLALIFFRSKLMSYNKKIICVVVFGGLVLMVGYHFINFHRLFQMFSVSSISNHARLNYWKVAIQQFFNYGIFEIMGGNPLYYMVNHSNSTESVWLQILVDNGLPLLICYLVFLLKYLINDRKNYYFYGSVLLLTGAVAPYYSSIVPLAFYWVAIFSSFGQLNSFNRFIRLGSLKRAVMK